jgi:small subunit ribosomal protein S3
VGQKIHPIGFRVGVNRGWDSRWFADKKHYADLLIEDLSLRKKIKKMMPGAAIARIEIERIANRVKITLHTGRPGMIIGKARRGVDDLIAELEKMLKRDVSVDVVEIRHPELEAQLVAESVAQQIEKRVAYKRAMRQAMTRAMRMGGRGIKIQSKGRLGGAEMARIEVVKDGKVPLHTLRADIDYGFAEAATTYGNIGVKVWVYKGDILGTSRHGLPERIFQERAPRPERPRFRDGGDRDRRGGPGGGRGGRGGPGGGRGGAGGGGYRGGGGGGRGGR